MAEFGLDLNVIEVNDWKSVNKELRQHGLPSVNILHPQHAKATDAVIVLELEASKVLRNTLQSLLRDCDRRQDLIQELITTNNKLRNELKEQTDTTTKYESRSRDLRDMLNESQDKVRELEASILNMSNMSALGEEKLTNTKTAAQTKCKQLELQCKAQELEITRLTEKIGQLSAEEKWRLERNHKAFAELRKSTKNMVSKDSVLDMIDSYERKLHSLKKQQKSRNEKEKKDSSSSESEREETPNYKVLIKTYEKEIKGLKKKLKNCENEKEILKLDLLSRPDLEVHKDAVHKIKNLERMLKRYNHGETRQQSHKEKLRFSTSVEDVEFLPASHCHVYLKTICDELAVSDVNEIIPQIKKISVPHEALPKLEQFAADVLTLVSQDELLLPAEYRDRPEPERRHKLWCDKTMHHVLPTLKYWHRQLTLLMKLQEAVNRLGGTFVPWRKINLHGAPSTQQIITTLDSFMEEQQGPPKQQEKTRGSASKVMLQGIVEHFMTLFSVRQVSGVYARMNDIYNKLGEVHNVMHALKDVLGLDKNEKTSVLIDTVARLSQVHKATTTEQLKQLLQTDDLNSIVTKLQEHEEFFPIFRDIMAKVMAVLEVRRLDQVVPAVQRLKDTVQK